MEHAELRAKVEAAFADRSQLADASVKQAVLDTVQMLDQGKLRVATCDAPANGRRTPGSSKPCCSISASSRWRRSTSAPWEFYDKIPLKKNLDEAGVRVVPPGTVRYGSFIEKGAIVMPGYVNIGAYVGAGTMVDTWATVGSCAQVGKDCHLSGGVGLGGVLEPPGAQPVIIEDGCFIGSRAIIVEGMLVEREAVIGAGVALTASRPRF